MTQGNYPDWMPFLGGKYFMFFRPVFNIADSAITIGVLSILIFQRSIFVNSDSEQKPATESTNPVELQEPVAEEEQPKT
jgi:signal peptidase II